MCSDIEYDEESEHDQDIVGAFVDHKTVCAGYSKAFQYLMTQLDIDCIVVTGTHTGDENNIQRHSWNILKLDGKYYNVDVTSADLDDFYTNDDGETEPDIDYSFCLFPDERCKELGLASDMGLELPDCIDSIE